MAEYGSVGTGSKNKGLGGTMWKNVGRADAGWKSNDKGGGR